MLRGLLLFLGFAQELMYILARAPGGQMQGARAEGDVGAYRRGAGNADPGPPSAACGGTAAGPDARPPPRPEGLRPAGSRDDISRSATPYTADILLARVRAQPAGRQQNVKVFLRQP